MTHHIKEFTVHDYKGIHELTLKDIAPINILTGDNNSGKTSLLELLATTDNPANLWSWLPAIRVNSSNYHGFYHNSTYFEGFYNLFPCNQGKRKVIEYEWLNMIEARYKWQLSGTIFNTQIFESELNKINNIVLVGTQNPENEKGRLLDTQGIKLSFSSNGTCLKESKTIYDRQLRMSENKPIFMNYNIIFVSSVENEHYYYYLNHILQDPEAYSLLEDMLKVFDPDIITLNAIKSDIAPSIVNYQILSKRHNQSLPLSAYGEGMKKAAYLLGALYVAKNGILLIDEFETGIHTSCMDQVFSLLLENALKLNVQIFMTSHSKEAISKVLRLSPDIQKNIALYTLFMYKGKNYARRVNCQEAIKMQEELGMELR